MSKRIPLIVIVFVFCSLAALAGENFDREIKTVALNLENLVNNTKSDADQSKFQVSTYCYGAALMLSHGNQAQDLAVKLSKMQTTDLRKDRLTDIHTLVDEMDGICHLVKDSAGTPEDVLAILKGKFESVENLAQQL